jgi:CheY-like chemotaxis protein
MSHEIRNPLNGIMGMAELLKDTNLSETQKEHVISITASCHSLEALVNGIRDFSATETGHLELKVKNFKLRELISKSIEYALPKASGKNVELKSAVDEDVPDFLSGDPQKVMQVLTTLIENAVFFMNNGFVELNVKSGECENKKVELLFEVSDNGPGIDSDKLDFIFDFSHEEIATSREFSSISLGFSVCKSIVEALGGSIKVESEESKGSTFSFSVPFEIAQEEPEKEKPVFDEKKKTSEEAAKPSRKIKALLAEDDPVNQKVECAFLKKAGCDEVEIASDGEKVIEMFKESSYDIIFMDCEMPKKNGFMATGEIRKIEEERGAERTPIIAMTANALPADIQKSLDAGMDDHAAKPITIEDLAEIVRKHTS